MQIDDKGKNITPTQTLEPKSKERQSNFELLRIVAMLMIVAGHFLGQSGYLDYAKGLNYWIGELLGNGARIAVNIFLILGVWYMVDAKFKVCRITQLWCQVWTWTIPITLLVIAFGLPVSKDEVFRGLFPIVSKGIWFASGYIALLMLSPWLQNILQWEKIHLKKYLFVMFLLTTVWVTAWTFNRTEDQWLDILVWFSFIYLFIGYYKHYVAENLQYNKWILLGIGIFIYLFLVLIHSYIGYYHLTGKTAKLIDKCVYAFLMDYKTLPNFIVSMLFFEFFRKLRLGINYYINFLAAGAFSVYIVHQTPVFIPVLWKHIYKTKLWAGGDYAIIYYIGGTLLVYLVVTILDYYRKKYVEQILLNTPMIRFIEKKLNTFYGDN